MGKGDATLAVLFITLNEEYHIGAAIDNIKDIADEIWVVDSGSTDKTVEIAKSKGAQVVYHKFENFGAQWNFALGLPVKSAWTMKMDPDERLTDGLKSEITDNISRQTATGYSFDRILYFMQKPLPFCTALVIRIWKTGSCRFSDVKVNEHPLIDGPVVKLKGKMLHLDTKDLSSWVEKQNRYSTMEAEMGFNREAFSVKPRFWGSWLERRMWLKANFRRLPGRYLALFLYYYFAKGIWRTGSVGLYWLHSRIMVSRMIEMKIKEMEWSKGEQA